MHNETWEMAFSFKDEKNITNFKTAKCNRNERDIIKLEQQS